VLLSIAALPVFPLTIALGSAYGIWRGFLIAMPSSVLAAIVVFLLGQSILRERAHRQVAGWPKGAAIMRAVGRSGWIAILLRLSPIVPYNVINYALSLTDLPPGTYVTTTVVGIVPATFMWLYLGAAGATVAAGAKFTTFQLAMYLLGLIATVLAVWLIGREVRRSVDELTPGRPS